MFRRHKNRTGVSLVALAVTASLALAACGGDDEGDDASATTSSAAASAAASTPASSAATSASSAAASPDASATSSAASSEAATSSAAPATGESAEINMAFWGNDVRKGFYDKAMAAFSAKYPNIKVNVSFLGFPEYWEKRQIEATGGGLPDVMQMDYTYLRQYAENNLLLDLAPHLGQEIKTDGFGEEILKIGVINDKTYAITIGTNAWGLFLNPKLLEQVGVEPYKGGGTYAEYAAWIKSVTDAAKAKKLEIYGGNDFTGRIQNLELQLRAEGKSLFTEDKKPGFDKARLKKFWSDGEALRKGGGTPQKKLEESYPKSGFDTAVAASELTWDNFGAGYLGNLGKDYTELGLVAPPETVAGAKDLYQKPSMLHSISAKTKHPKEAALLVDFLINSPEAGAAFGTNRGLPASKTQLDGVKLEGLGKQVADYEASIASRLGPPPPVPIVGSGTIEEKFRVLGTELGLGTTSVDDAVDQFFDEMDVVLNK